MCFDVFSLMVSSLFFVSIFRSVYYWFRSSDLTLLINLFRSQLKASQCSKFSTVFRALTRNKASLRLKARQDQRVSEDKLTQADDEVSISFHAFSNLLGLPGPMCHGSLRPPG